LNICYLSGFEAIEFAGIYITYFHSGRIEGAGKVFGVHFIDTQFEKRFPLVFMKTKASGL
jgi:hypothetical protein